MPPFLLLAVHSCSVPLGLEDKRIPDDAFTASGSANNNHRPSLARLNLLSNGADVGAWCPKAKSTNQWLQIDLGAITAVTKVATQGQPGSEDRVTTYKLSHSVDGIHWIGYKQRAVDKVINLRRIPAYKPDEHWLRGFFVVIFEILQKTCREPRVSTMEASTDVVKCQVRSVPKVTY